MRLTALYGGLFLVTGALLLTITYLLVASHIGSGGMAVTAHAVAPSSVGIPGAKVTIQAGTPGSGGGAVFLSRGASVQAGTLPPLPAGLSPAQRKRLLRAQRQLNATLAAAIKVQRSSDLSQLLLWSGTALAIMALASVLIGWLVAGRVLEPLRTMTASTRRISADNLDQRLELSGPDDELRDLGETINGLLTRLERVFDAQRRFVANASHELRTPMTLQRAMIEVALADPYADTDSLRAACARVIAAGEEQERLVEALLTLARSQRGLARHEPVDLADTVATALADAARIGAHPDIRVDARLDVARAAGDPRLVNRLAANLLDNALRHNVAAGWVSVETLSAGDQAVLRVVNSGPPIPPGTVGDLLEPFRRSAPERAGRSGDGAGHGLGLSIAAAIAHAHGATMTLHARAEGGLDVVVRFPVPAAASATPGAGHLTGAPAGRPPQPEPSATGQGRTLSA